ncbi:MAG: TlyA family RNA methyltransferase [Candidatus Paceibacterota bacterium]|jgi:23S rRNA (cytidine1920-2'-O)/16S rRNA (cytidine1409-2'-O)-methyltransferase
MSRLDVELVNRGLARSRTIAQTLIEQGAVLLNEQPAEKSSTNISPIDKLEVIADLPYVSRAGVKLEKALDEFELNPSGLVVLDVGSSTGGFTDCLIQNGAIKVYAVDVGTGQLNPELKKNLKVVSIEQTDIRNLASIPEQADLAVIDVSFISLTKVLPAVKKFLKPQAKIIALVKPQFEVGPDIVNKKGVVADVKIREKALQDVIAWTEQNGFVFLKQIESPIHGTDGNTEYLIYLSI